MQFAAVCLPTPTIRTHRSQAKPMLQKKNTCTILLTQFTDCYFYIFIITSLLFVSVGRCSFGDQCWSVSDTCDCARCDRQVCVGFRPIVWTRPLPLPAGRYEKSDECCTETNTNCSNVLVYGLPIIKCLRREEILTD